VHVVHQTGPERVDDVRKAYDTAGLGGAVVVPFLDDVAHEMARADLVVARAGAVTVAEIAAIGRASLLVPFPHAADDHQAKNAAALAELGGAVSLRQEAADEVRLAVELELLLGDDERRTRMADAARSHGRPDAADDVAKDLLALAGLTRRKLAAPDKTNGSHSNGSNGSVTHRHPGKEVS
jgi:UDP-N-acetylglucosamine--N-acetylmuramyl-(pentapeptide) pyrophosphoryl-undecaprenol N-acetylglucosamine transferase